MTTHSNGNWRAEINARNGRPGVVSDNTQANAFYSIAECYGPDNGANARLIAAAPDLLAALKAIEYSDRTGAAMGEAVLCRAFAARARAAIAKAEGGAP